eukprot:scaffold7358_cov252-Pinguiococcus_pyrenoidosus.AAC.34
MAHQQALRVPRDQEVLVRIEEGGTILTLILLPLIARIRSLRRFQLLRRPSPLSLRVARLSQRRRARFYVILPRQKHQKIPRLVSQVRVQLQARRRRRCHVVLRGSREVAHVDAEGPAGNSEQSRPGKVFLKDLCLQSGRHDHDAQWWEASVSAAPPALRSFHESEQNIAAALRGWFRPQNARGSRSSAPKALEAPQPLVWRRSQPPRVVAESPPAATSPSSAKFRRHTVEDAEVAWISRCPSLQPPVECRCAAARPALRYVARE